MTGINPNPNLQTFNQLYGTGYQPSSMVSLPVSSNTTPLNTVPSAPAPDLNTNNRFEKTPKADTITIAGKTIKKKTAIIGGLSALAVAVAVGAAIVFGARRGKTPVIPPETKMPEIPPETAQVVDEAKEAISKRVDDITEMVKDDVRKVDELAENIQKKVDEIYTLFKNGGKNADGKTVAQLETKKNGLTDVQIMTEFAEDGKTIVRKSEFHEFDGLIAEITEFLEGGKTNCIDACDGKLRSYDEGIEILTDGSKRFAKKLEMYNGKAHHYYEGLEQSPGGIYKKYAKNISGIHSGDKHCSLGHEKLEDDTEIFAMNLMFEEDFKPLMFRINERIPKDGKLADIESDEYFKFDLTGGKLISYVNNKEGKKYYW